MVKRNQIIAVCLVVLGILLHLAFRNVSHSIAVLFPRTLQEGPQEIVFSEPLIFSEEDVEELPLPPSPTLSAASSPYQSRPQSTPGRFPSPSETSVEKDAVPRQDQVALLSPLDLPPKKQEWEDFKKRRKDVSSARNLFQTHASLIPQVDFWRKIYGVYHSQQILIHDAETFEIYRLLDFSFLDRSNLSSADKKLQKEKTIAEEMRQLGERDNLRVQNGLKDRFKEGLKRSGRYMPIFEKIFESHGVPVEISRLCFVESLFHERALSKVGAGGLWQFMPSSAKRYMTVSSWLDERYDPIIATHGAAELLRYNYDLLGSWPLAINAYNSGPGNLQKAIQKLKTRDIVTIIQYYKGGSYAFASRNFYPSFLAALEVYENQEAYFGPIQKVPLIEFDLASLPAPLTFPEIAALSESSVEDLKQLNPAFSSSIFDGIQPLPIGSPIRLPFNRSATFRSRFLARQDTQDTQDALTE